MKTSIRAIGMSAALAFGLVAGRPALAATLTWDADTGTGGPQNGAGTWQTGIGALWWDGAANTTFTDGDTAIFGTNTTGTSAYTITVVNTVRTPLLIFSNYTTTANAKYTLTGGTIDLGTGGKISTIANTTPGLGPGLGPVINSSIVATNLTTEGAGYLYWGGANALRGTLTVGNGPRLVINVLGAIQGGNNALDTIVLNAGKRIEHNAAGTYTTPIEMGGGGATLSTQIEGVTLAGDVTIGGTGNNNLNVDFARRLTFTGAFSGSGNLAFIFAGTGSGTNLFKGQATYTGATYIAGDNDLVILSGGDNRLPVTTTVAMNTSGTKLVLGDGDGSVNQTIAGLAGNNALARVVGGNAAVSTLTIGGAPGVMSTFIGVLGGPGANEDNLALVKTGGGAQVLTNANTYTGGTTINGGTLDFARKAALPFTGNVVVGANGAVALGVDAAGFDFWSTGDIDALWANALLGFTLDASSRIGIDTRVEDITYASDLSTRGLIKLGPYALTLTGNNTYAGGTEIYNGTLIVGANALGTGQLVLGGGTLSNTVSRSIPDIINLAAVSTVGVASATTFTIAGGTTNGGGLTKTGEGSLTISGPAAHRGTTVFEQGTIQIEASGGLRTGFDIVLGTVSNAPAVLDLQGGSISGRTFYVGQGSAGRTGIVNHVSGDVDLTGQNGLLVGNGGGSVGIYNLSGGTLRANTDMGMAGYGIILGVNGGSTGILNVTGGTLETRRLEAGRDWAESGLPGLFTQSAGTTVAGDLAVAGGQNQRSELTVSGGTFTATNFYALAHRTGATGILHLAAGATVHLKGIPTARGANSYAELTLDGAVVRPLAATNAFMSNLTRAFVTTNGAIFDVATGRDITIAQSFEDAAGQTGIFVKRGAGVLSLTGTNNAFTGVTTVEQGMLSSTSQGAAGATPLIVVSNAATYRVNFPTLGTITNDFRLAGATATIQYWQNSAQLNLAGQITLDGGGRIMTFNGGTSTNVVERGIAGTGNLTLSANAANNGDGVLVLEGQSSYTGDTILTTASARFNRTRIDTDNALPVTTLLRVQTGAVGGALLNPGVPETLWTRFSLNGHSQEVAGITSFNQYAGQTNSIVGGAAALSTLTVNNPSDHTFAGRIGGGGANEDNLALVKKGTGTLTLTFDNTYAGATTVEAGRLAVHGAHTGGGLITVTGGTLGGTGSVGAVTIGPVGTLAPGASIGTLSAASLTLDGGASLDWELDDDGFTSDLLVLSGALAKGALGAWAFDFLGTGAVGSYTLITFGTTDFATGDFAVTNLKPGLSGGIAVNANDVTLTVVPEPASLGVLGLLTVAALLRRRARAHG